MKKTSKAVAVIVGATSKHDKYGDPTGLPASIRWGLGGALSQRFAKDYTAVLLGRSLQGMADLVEEIEDQGGHAIPMACDVTDDAAVEETFSQIADIGTIEVFIYNVAPPYQPRTNFSNLPQPHEVDPEHLQKGFDIGVIGCLRCVRAVIPPMLKAKKGSILLTGATQGFRGSATFASMSPIKFALRSFGQSLFQAYAPQGIHVAHVVIDGAIDSPGLREQFADADVAFLDPAEIAESYMMLVNQPPTCWSYELQLTPFNSALGMRL